MLQIISLVYQVAEIVGVQGERNFYRYYHPRTMEERHNLVQLKSETRGILEKLRLVR
jgi:hypothetical protein